MALPRPTVADWLPLAWATLSRPVGPEENAVPLDSQTSTFHSQPLKRFLRRGDIHSPHNRRRYTNDEITYQTSELHLPQRRLRMA